MPPDCYKVEVLHLLNPHLIWVEVRDSAITSADEHGIKFEQIGIYGVLPLETTIDLDDEELTVQKCQEWLPASATLMRKFFADEDEILFTPIHLDRRSSVFDDNVHKFGDLLVKKKNGKTKSLSQLLRTSGFATYDACLFHQHLSGGKINTKLNNTETQEVLTELEKYFINKNVPKKKWEKPINKHTSVARASYDLEEALTKTNLDKHNKHMRAILESKNKDLELCKGVDEPSVGRATTRKGKEKTRLTPVEKKLELLQNYKTKADSKDLNSPENNSNEHAQAFEDTKKYLEANAFPYSKKISSKTDAHKAQILKKVMSKTAIKRISKQEKLVNKLLNESKEPEEPKEPEVRTLLNQTNDSYSSSSHNSISESEHDEVPKIEETNHFVETDNIAASSTQDQNTLDTNNAVIAHNTSVFENEVSNIKSKSSSKPHQERSIKAQNTVVPSPKVDQKHGFHYSRHGGHHRRFSRGKGNKRAAKAEVYVPTLKPQEPISQSEHGAQTRSISPPQQRLAYPPQNVTGDQEPHNSIRVPVLPNDCEAFASKPVSEYTVQKLMTTFKLNGSKHSAMIQDAIRKCKDGGKNNTEAIEALLECRNKIIDEIKELDDPKNLANLDLDLPVSQTVAKTKLKRRGRKHSVVSTRTKTIFGPPGLDINILARVPPVFLYGEEISKNDGLNTKLTPNSIDTFENEDVTPDGDKNNILNFTYENKPVTKNVRMQESEIKKERNENKDTSSSNSSVWERRLKLHKELAKSKRSASTTSDTTNKDSSNTEENTPPKNFIKQNAEEDSDESISGIIEKLTIANNMCFASIFNQVTNDSIYTCQQVGVKANPFQNFDINNSMFVDNLVTPVMMVHSVMNKRFVPTCTYGDIHFSEHIRLVLKNIHVDRPMMIQSVAWNAILRGHSVFMIGSASSGKTMGYLPAVCNLVTDFNQSESYCDSVGPFCIIICATSQSVSEIEENAKMLVGCNEKVLACYHGYDELAIATSLLNGCDLLICTAPSLVRLLQMPEFGVDLQRLATFVLDDCERLSEVYSMELKFCLYKIKEMLRSRVNKELLVQYIVASRTWGDFMEPFAKKAPDTVICIGAFQECVLYSKANMTVSYVKRENKLHHLMDFLEEIDPSKRTVVVCDSDEEVDYLNRAIQTPKYFIFASSSKMTVQSLYNLSMLWKEFREPLMAPVLICRDANLYHMNIVNAHYLVQYSMPNLYSTFCKRFATLNENYPSLFKTDNEPIKILILLEENNVKQFPKIVNFVKRCTNNIPEVLGDVCTRVLAQKDAKKAESFVPLCNTLMNLGECPDYYNCKSRHTIIKEYDTPKEWIPKSGIVTFKILHYQSATLYSARLITNFDVGKHIKYPASYSSMSLKMGMHYSNKRNRISFGIPKLGDICAVSVRNNLFSRGQIIKIIDSNERGNPKNFLVNLLDEEIIEITTDTNLYHLPDDFKNLETYVVHVRLANIQPRDKDVVFSELAKDYVKREAKDDLTKAIYMKGKIVLTIANCIFVDTLEACQDLKSLNETVVMYNVKRDLLEKHAEVNPDHLTKLALLCNKAGLEIKPIENEVNEILPPVKVTPKISWAHLDEDMCMVDFGIVENPDLLFVRLTKFEECMKILIKDIQKYLTDNCAKIAEFIKDDIVLAEYPDDGMYERARIDEIGEEKVKCFFVDQGEWRHLNKDKLLAISDTLVTQLPFQAIECRLVGLKPAGEQWSDFASNWLFDKCTENETRAAKHLFVKYFTKEPAQFSGGHKYGVVVIDTYGDEDVNINQAMIDLNLGKVVEDEIKFLSLVTRKNEQEVKFEQQEDDDDSWEKLSKHSSNSDITANETFNNMLSQPIRSVPLIGTDDESDDSDKWNINLTSNMAEMFKPLIDNSAQNTDIKVPAIQFNETAILEKIDIDSVSKNIEECSRQFHHVKINPDSSKELDSDDLSSPETFQSASETSEKAAEVVILEESQLRKPKLNWRQTKSTLMIKIQLIGVEKYDLEIGDRALTFRATMNDTNYGFDFDLYGVIDRKSAIHSNKGQYILVKLNKIMHKNWLTLTKDGGIRKWIVYDVDSIDTSSEEEEEEVQNDNLYNIMKNMHNNEDSDSDDEFVDDVSFKLKHD